MITAEEAIEIYRKKYPKSDILKIKKVENFGFWLETSDIREDDCINLVTFDGKLERFPFSPVCPNPEFESAKKTEKIFYKKRKKDKIWWIDHPDSVGRIEVSFDRKKS